MSGTWFKNRSERNRITFLWMAVENVAESALIETSTFEPFTIIHLPWAISHQP
jgi:hypothetical protein